MIIIMLILIYTSFHVHMFLCVHGRRDLPVWDPCRNREVARGSYNGGLSFSARREVYSPLLLLKTSQRQRQSLTWRAARARASICMPITPAFHFVSVYVRETLRVKSPVTHVRRSNSFCSADPVQCVLTSTEAETARFTQLLDTQPP